MSKKIKDKIKISLRVPDEVWSEFKVIIPRTIPLNDAVVKLIEQEVEKRK